MKWALWLSIAGLVPPRAAFGYTETFYVCHGGDGTDAETDSCATAYDTTHFNLTANWASTNSDDGKIGPNDLVVFMDDGGWFDERMWVRASGLSGAPITLQNQSGDSPTIQWGFWLEGVSHIVIDGIQFNSNGYNIRAQTSGGYLEVKNCTFQGYDLGILLLDDVSHNYIHDNSFLEGKEAIDENEHDSIGIGWVGRPSHFNRIINNTFIDGGGHFFVMFSGGSNYNVVRGNTFIVTDYWNTAQSPDNAVIDGHIGMVQTEKFNLIEKNVGIIDPGAYKSGVPIQVSSSSKNIFRMNTFSQVFRPGGGTNWACYNSSAGVEYNTIYNNTFFNSKPFEACTYCAELFLNPQDTGGNIQFNEFVNNIFWTNQRIGFNDADTANYSFMIENHHRNNILKSNSSSSEVRHLGSYYSLEVAESSFPSLYSGNLEDAPDFVDEMNGDFAPASASAAQVDAGTWLTRTDGSASGSSQLVVDNPFFFFDGYGLPGEVADCVCVVGDGSPAGFVAQISSIDYDARTLTLASPHSWDDGARVYLAHSPTVGYFGSGPDIGAEEFVVAAEGPTVPTNLSIQ